MTTESMKNEEKTRDDNTPEEQPITCAICDEADELVAPFVSAIAEIRKQLKSLQKPVSSLRMEAIKPHPKCAKCGVFLGGTHSGGPLPLPEAQQGMCGRCSEKYHVDLAKKQWVGKRKTRRGSAYGEIPS